MTAQPNELARTREALKALRQAVLDRSFATNGRIYLSFMNPIDRIDRYLERLAEIDGRPMDRAVLADGVKILAAMAAYDMNGNILQLDDDGRDRRYRVELVVHPVEAKQAPAPASIDGTADQLVALLRVLGAAVGVVGRTEPAEGGQ